MMDKPFCPRCGSKLQTQLIDGRQRSVCPACAWIVYEHSAPCVGILIIQESRLLLVQRDREPFKGWWDIPGGFLEAGEDPRAGAIREAEEETGLLVEPEEIVGIYVDTYGESGEYTLNICYIAKVIGGTERAGSDAGALGWFDLEALPDNIAFEWPRQALQHLQALRRS